MLAVSNTSPLSNLAIIGRLELLQDRYGQVRIPVAVARELAQLTHPGGKSRLPLAWIPIRPSAFLRHSSFSPLPPAAGCRLKAESRK